MKFNDEVVMQDVGGIPLVGNLANGYVIGLTGDGAEACRRMLREDVPADEIAAIDANLLQHLTQGGFFTQAQEAVVEIGCDGVGHTTQDAESSSETPASGPAPLRGPVLSAYLHVTQRCNLACRGCYSLDEHRNVLDDAPLSDVCRAIDQLTAAGLQRLVISGGEPFLRDDLPDIVRHAKQDCGIPRVDVLSNGTRITAEALEGLAPYVDGVSVSFDGCSADSVPYIRREQRFDELVAAVRMVQGAGIAAHIIPTAHAKNIHELPKYVALAVDSPIGMNLTVKRDCGAGARTISVDADGTVYPCHMMHRPQLAMGNAFTGSLSDALAGEVGETMRSLMVEDCEGCNECRYEYICGGGCRARSLYATGSLRQPDSYCAMICEFYDTLGTHMAANLGAQK